MKTSIRIALIILVMLAATATVLLKGNKSHQSVNIAPQQATTAGPAAAAVKLPKLIDLGANKCIPCKMMAPILDELKKTYAGRLEVEFIDIWQNENAGKEYGVEMIPTQIFYDAEGKELFRHTGFFSKDDILAKWQELGVDLRSDAAR